MTIKDKRLGNLIIRPPGVFLYTTHYFKDLHVYYTRPKRYLSKRRGLAYNTGKPKSLHASYS